MARFRKARRSVAEFCRQEGVSAPSFYQWRKRLNEVSSQAGGTDRDRANGFRPVRLVGLGEIIVELPGGTQLHVPTSDPQALQVVIGTLARADARRAGGSPC